MAGAGNPWTCGCELGADVSWNAAAGCVGCVACAALCRGTQWQAVRIGVGRVACVALCPGDCWWACRVGAVVPLGWLVGVSRRRCAMGIAGGRVEWAALCHGDCWWACRVGGAVPWDCWWACRVGGAAPWGLLVGESSFLGFGTGPGVGEVERLMFKGRARIAKFLALVRARALGRGDPKRLIFKGRASEESSFLRFNVFLRRFRNGTWRRSWT